jgi:CRISPR-associated protein Cas4
MSQFANLWFPKTPYGLENLAQILDASYSDSTNRHEHIQKKTFSPSSVGYGSGKCPRRWVLAFRGADFIENHSSKSVDNMSAGTSAHERIQANFNNSKLETEIEREITSEDPPIRGFVDLIIKDYNGHNIVIEIKTTRTEAWRSRMVKNAGPEYQVLQLLIYLYVLEEKYGILLYEDKNDHQKLMIPVEMTPENKEKVEMVFDWMREVYKTYEEDKLPKNPFRSNSKICKECPIQKWCYSQPEGDTEVPVLKYED